MKQGPGRNHLFAQDLKRPRYAGRNSQTIVRLANGLTNVGFDWFFSGSLIDRLHETYDSRNLHGFRLSC